MNGLKEIAKFGCGFEAFHAIAHLYLWLSGTTLQVFAITLTPTWSVGAGVAHAAVAILLGVYAWRPGRQAAA